MTRNINSAVVSIATAIMLLASVAGPVDAEPSRTEATETVWVIFHAKHGQETVLRDLLHESWRLYVRKHMVALQRPHVLGEGEEEGGKYFFELLTWNSPEAPDAADADVRAHWKKLEDACESRHGDSGIEFHEISLLTAPAR